MVEHTGNIMAVALDHDLGDYTYRGYGVPTFDGTYVADWMMNTDNLPTKVIYIHSSNDAGSKRMFATLSNNKKNVSVLRIGYWDLLKLG